MTLCFGKINNSTDQMIDCFEKRGISMDVVGIKDASKVAAAVTKVAAAVTKVGAAVTKGVRRSIFKTMIAPGGGMKSGAFAPVDVDPRTSVHGATSAARVSFRLMSYCIMPRLLSVDEWKSRAAVSVKVYRNMCR